MTLDREVPQAGDLMWGGDTAQEFGFAVYAGQHYVAQFAMAERDAATSNEHMGYVIHFVDAGDPGLGFTTRTQRSIVNDGPRAGDYTITWEIRRAPLPDLRPVNIKVEDLPGRAKQRVCMAVQNVEVGVAGPFEAALRVDDVVPPDGRITAGAPAPGNHVWACVETALPTSGQHVLSAVVDEPRVLTEFNETNNVYQHPEPYVAAQPTPTPSPALPDLTVSAIRVNGHVPDGKDDCKDGKNAVAVVVKNAGAAAGAFALRLVVDGDDEAEEKPVADLEGGQEREVRFDDVRLKQGERTLTAVADAKDALAESKEVNNELKVTARCKDD